MPVKGTLGPTVFFYIQSKEALTHETVLNQTAFHVQLLTNKCGFILIVFTVLEGQGDPKQNLNDSILKV